MERTTQVSGAPTHVRAFDDLNIHIVRIEDAVLRPGMDTFAVNLRMIAAGRDDVDGPRVCAACNAPWSRPRGPAVVADVFAPAENDLPGVGALCGVCAHCAGGPHDLDGVAFTLAQDIQESRMAARAKVNAKPHPWTAHVNALIERKAAALATQKIALMQAQPMGGVQ